MNPTDKLARIRLIVIVGFAAAVLYHLCQAFALGSPDYGRTTFLFNPGDRFGDFFNLQGAARTLDPYQYPGSVYFPFAFISVFPFMLLKGWFGLIPFLASVSAIVWRHCRKAFERIGANSPGRSTFAVAFLSYPVLFELDRANFEGWVFVLLALFLEARRRGKQEAAAALLGGAAAIKGYPGLFFLLFLSERRYREIGIFFATIVAVSLGSAAVYETGVVGSLLKLQSNLKWFHDTYVVTLDSLVFSSSLFSALRIALSPFISGLLPVDRAVTESWAGHYMILSGVLQLAVIGWVLLIEKTLWKRVYLMVASFILLPPVSFDYKLIHLLLPLTLFIEERAGDSRRDRLYSTLFGLLLVPKAYFILFEAGPPGGVPTMPVSLTSVLNPALLLAMAIAIALDRSGRAKPTVA